MSSPLRRRPPLAVVAALGLGAGATLVLGACTDHAGEEAYCERARELASADPSAVLARFDIDDPDADPAPLRAVVDALEGLGEVAPDAVADDAVEVASTSAEVVDALTALEADPDGARARLRELEGRYDRFAAASARVVADARERCDVTLDGETADPTAPTTAATATTAVTG